MKRRSLPEAWRDLQGALSAAVLLCRVAWALGREPFPDLLDRLRLRDAGPPADTERVHQAQADVRRAHRLVPLERNCLLDSLAAAALVRRQGYSVPLGIGVRMEQGEFLAHAWLGAEASAGAEGFRLLYRVPRED